MKKWMLICLAIILCSCSAAKPLPKPGYAQLPLQKHNSKEALLQDTVKLDETEFFARVDGKQGLINYEGTILIPMVYQKLYYTNSKEYLGKTETGYELLRNYQVVPEFQAVMHRLETEYDSYLYEEKIGLWRVRKDDKRTYVTMEGKQVTEELFDQVTPVSVPTDGDGYHYYASNIFASHRKQDGTYYCLIHNLDGKQIIPDELLSWEYDGNLGCQVNVMSSFSGTVIASQSVPVSSVFIEENGKVSGYDNQGNNLFKYAEQYNYVDGTHIEYELNGELYLLDLQTMQKQKQIKNYQVIGGGYRVEMQDGLYGFTHNGKVLIPFQFESIQPVDYYDLTDYIIATKQGMHEMYDWDGTRLFSYDPKQVTIRNTKDKSFWIAFNHENKVQLWNQQGKPLLDEWFDQIDVGHHFIMTSKDQIKVIYDKSMKQVEQTEGYGDVMMSNYNAFYIMQDQGKVIVKDGNADIIGDLIAQVGELMIVNQKDELYAYAYDMQLPLGYYSNDKQIPVISIVHDGLFITYENTIYHINTLEKTYFKLEADQVHRLGNMELTQLGYVTFYKISKNGKMALMADTGVFLTGFEYDDFGLASRYGYMVAKQQGTWVVLNFKGEKVVDSIELKTGQELDDLEFTRIREWYLTEETDKMPNEFGRWIYTK